jgi:Putative DNA-binding domain
MQPFEDQIQSLVNQPSEKLNVELKPWIDPSSKKGQSVIAKASLALRNQNGGFLLIGFDDNGSPLPVENGLDVRAAFHIDNIQKIVSQFASKPFSVEVHFRQRDGVDYPVIQVESGVKTPVACRADLKDTDGKKLLSVNEIYVRTLNANGIASSSRIKGNDFDDLVERCFQNREADHAAFLFKLIRGLSRSDAASLFSAISQGYQVANENPRDAERKILDNGWSRFTQEARERSVDLNAFGFLEGALRIAGHIKSYKPSAEFLQFVESANPTLTGWPIWLVSRSFSNEKARSYTYQVYMGTVHPNSRFFWPSLGLHDFQPKG